MKKKVLKHASITELDYLITSETKITKLDFKSIFGERIKNYIMIENGDYVYYLPVKYIMESDVSPSIYTIKNKIKVKVIGFFNDSKLKTYEIYDINADKIITEEDLMERIILCLF